MKMELNDITGTDNSFTHFGVDRPMEQKTIPIANSWVLFLQMSYGFLKQKQDQSIH